MKITFILHTLELSGGHKAVFEFGNCLHKRGHEVSIIHPIVPLRSGAKWCSIKDQASRAWRTLGRIRKRSRVEWFDLKAKLIKTPTLAERYIPNADIIVATWWETAYYVDRYRSTKGEKFYLVQHYEIWGGPKELVNNSYKLGLRIIVNSSWLKKILLDQFKVDMTALIPHAPDLNQFFPESIVRNNDKTRILMAYRNLKWKGIEDGIRAFEIVKRHHPNIQLVMFGPKLTKDVPKHVEFHENPSNDSLRTIYNSCDIFLFTSHYEGFGMPPMEAMACKCAVVTTDVGAVRDYTIPGETALISPPKAPKILAENISLLIKNDKLRKRIAEAAYNYITKNFSWAKATEALEKTFNRALSARKTTNL